MSFKKSSARGLAVLIMCASVFILGLRGVKLESITFGGTLVAVSDDGKSIVLRGAKVSTVMISPGTRVVDEKGAVLGIRNLPSGSTLEVEGWNNPRGPFYARKITVKAPRQQP